MINDDNRGGWDYELSHAKVCKYSMFDDAYNAMV